MNPLLFRTDASPHIGSGHVMRCLALAQQWQRQGGTSLFLSVDCPPPLLQRLQAEGMNVLSIDTEPGSIQDARETARRARQVDAAWVVVDGYHFDGTYQRLLKEEGVPILFFDDYGHASEYAADIVLNQNVYAVGSRYRNRSASSHLLLGTRFACLRAEFEPWQDSERFSSAVASRLLVTLGSTDPPKATFQVVDAFQDLQTSHLKTKVVIGSANPHYSTLGSATPQRSAHLELVTNVTNMPALMSWADLAISAGGTTLWELALLGVPDIALVLAENQSLNAATLGEIGAIVNLGSIESLRKEALVSELIALLDDQPRRARMARSGQMLVDGKGAARVVEKLQQPLPDTEIRPAASSDGFTLWRWANDPETRENSFNPMPIPWESHVEWYSAKLRAEESRFWMLESHSIPVGSIRYDKVADDTAEISYVVSPEHRGCGFGTMILRLSRELVCEALQVRYLRGVTFASNRASARAFEKSGFEYCSEEVIEGHLCRVYRYDCSAH